MKYSLIAILLGAVYVAARPQDENGSAKSSCSLKEVVIARGTSEGGPYGFIVGDPLVAELRRKLPELKFYAVKYPADTNQAPGTETGAKDVVKHINAQIVACPNAQFALVGYSQGARVVRLGASRLDPSAQAKVVAAVVYGDRGDKLGYPKFPPPILAKLKNNCHTGDPNCNEGGSIANHLEYNSGSYHKDSAAFIIAGFKGQPLPLTTNPPRVVSGDPNSPNKGNQHG